MKNMWRFGDETNRQSPYTYEPTGRVVPAEGDPEVERYQASLRARERPRLGLAWNRSRHPMRNWVITVGVVALIIVFLKPMLVFAAVAVAVVLGLVMLGLVAAGALLFAVRLALRGRLAYLGGQGAPFRRMGRWRR